MEDDLADVYARVFARWSRGSNVWPLSTTDVGVIGLWIAAILTLVTGYDYLRAGLRHVEGMDVAAAAMEKQNRIRLPQQVRIKARTHEYLALQDGVVVAKQR